MRARVYLALALAGLITPPLLLTIYLTQDGHTVGDMLGAPFESLVSTAVFADLSIAALAFWFWLSSEAPRVGINRWWPFIPATVFIGLCFAFPLFMYRRERALEAGAAAP